MAFKSGTTFAEFLPIINSCNFFISFNNTNEVSEVIVQEDRISIQFKDIGFISCFQLPNGIYLKPSFLSGYQKELDCISFRVQLDEKTRIVNSVYSEILSELSSLNLNGSGKSEVSKILVANGKSLNIRCKICDTDITSSVELLRVSQMPTVNWDSSSETWFCHAHDCELRPLKKSSLIPKIGECFYEEMSFYFNAEQLLASCKDICNNQIICGKCKSQIGSVSGSVVKLWSNAIKFMNKDDVVYSVSEIETLITLFSNLDKDSLGVNSRLVLQTESNPKKFLFLITMDTNLTLFMTENSFLYQYKRGHLRDCNSYMPPLKQMKLEDKNTFLENLEKVRSIKVLYRIKIGEDDESGSWSDDVNVHILPCDGTFFNVIYNYLLNANQCLPDSLKSINKMSVGYIVK